MRYSFSSPALWITLVLYLSPKGSDAATQSSAMRAKFSYRCPNGLLAGIEPLLVRGSLFFTTHEHSGNYDMHFTIGPQNITDFTKYPVLCEFALRSECKGKHNTRCYCEERNQDYQLRFVFVQTVLKEWRGKYVHAYLTRSGDTKKEVCFKMSTIIPDIYEEPEVNFTIDGGANIWPMALCTVTVQENAVHTFTMCANNLYYPAMAIDFKEQDRAMVYNTCFTRQVFLDDFGLEVVASYYDSCQRQASKRCLIKGLDDCTGLRKVVEKLVIGHQEVKSLEACELIFKFGSTQNVQFCVDFLRQPRIQLWHVNALLEESRPPHPECLITNLTLPLHNSRFYITYSDKCNRKGKILCTFNGLACKDCMTKAPLNTTQPSAGGDEASVIKTATKILMWLTILIIAISLGLTITYSYVKDKFCFKGGVRKKPAPAPVMKRTFGEAGEVITQSITEITEVTSLSSRVDAIPPFEFLTVPRKFSMSDTSNVTFRE